MRGALLLAHAATAGHGRTHLEHPLHALVARHADEACCTTEKFMDLDRAIVVEITQASEAKTARMLVPTAVAPGALLAIVEAVEVAADTTRTDATMAFRHDDTIITISQ